jgi:hypothetical protein
LIGFFLGIGILAGVGILMSHRIRGHKLLHKRRRIRIKLSHRGRS